MGKSRLYIGMPFCQRFFVQVFWKWEDIGRILRDLYDFNCVMLVLVQVQSLDLYEHPPGWRYLNNLRFDPDKNKTGLGCFLKPACVR